MSLELANLMLAAGMRVHTESSSEFGDTHCVELAFDSREEADRMADCLAALPDEHLAKAEEPKEPSTEPDVRPSDEEPRYFGSQRDPGDEDGSF